MNTLKVMFFYKYRQYLTLAVFLIGSLFMTNGFAKPSQTKLAVWVSEAAVFTYSFDFKSFIKQQKEIAKYFTADGWISYSKAMVDSKLPEDIQKNSYYVSAIPTMPPIVKEVSTNKWQATVYLLVLYKNSEYQQKQNLKVVIYFEKSDKLGKNGFAISSMQSIVTEKPCRCTKTASVAAYA